MNAVSNGQDQAAVPFFPLDRLVLDDLNPRREHDAGSIGALAESIRVCGLVQNLGGRLLPDGRVGIVAGGRRLAAMRRLAEQGVDIGPVPVALATSEDTALLWSHAENSAREALSPAEEIIAYRRLAETGKPFAAVATAFGVTEAHVARRMKLASLPDEIIAGLRAGRITLDQAAAFTVAPSVEAALALFARVAEGGYWRAEAIRRELSEAGFEASARIAKFVTLDAYRAAGGRVESDLFSESVYLQDKALVQRLANEKIEAVKADAVEAGGWLWAEYLDEPNAAWGLGDKFDMMSPVPGELSEAEAEEYDALAERHECGDQLEADEEDRLTELTERLDGVFTEGQRALGGVIFWIGYDGAINRREGLVRPEDKSAAIEAGLIREGWKRGGAVEDAEGEPTGPSFSGALSEDLGRIRLGAIQTTLLREPSMLTDMLAYVLSGAAGGRAGHFLDLTLGAPAVQPAKPGAYALPDALAPMDEMEFAAFRALPDDARRAGLLAGIARLVHPGWRTGGDDLALIATEIGADAREIWRPDAESLWSRVTVPYLEGTIRQLLDWTDETPAFAEFRKLKKKEKAEILEGLFIEGSPVRAEYQPTPEQIERIDQWTPEV